MPALSPTQIEDLDELTLSQFDKKNWKDISLKKQRYYMEDALRGRGSKTPSAGGKSMSFKVQVRNLGSFTLSGMFAQQTSENADLAAGVEIPWTKQQVGYNWDVDEESFQGEPAEIVDAIEMRVHACWNDWFDGMEERMWLAPTSSTENPMPPWGIPFWIQHANATSTVALNGGNPSGFTSGAGGLSSSVHSQWANWNVTYVTIDDDDFLLKLAECCDKAHFRAPHSYSELNKGGPDWGFYTVYAVLQQLRKLAKAQNEDIGKDLGFYSEDVMFRRIPIHWVPALDESTSAAVRTDQPFYGINWRTLHYVFQKGKEMQKSPAIIPNKQASVREKFMWRWGNFKCTDRRSQFVLVKAA